MLRSPSAPEIGSRRHKAAAAWCASQVRKSAHQEELALHVAHDRLQPCGVELPVLAQHLREEAAQFRGRVRVRVQG